jgi:predicted dienelactone hydrolase
MRKLGHGLGASMLCVLVATAFPAPAAGALGVTTDERTFVDASRPTPENGACPAEPDRTLRTRLWIPSGACGGADPCPPYPLFVMAHGFGGLPEKFEAFATTIAAAGFVVASPAFPLTNQDTPCGLQFTDVTAQPEDLIFVVGELLTASANAVDALFGLVDPDALTVLGHSLGGVTVEGLAHTNCCAHPPLVASILVADLFGFATGIWERVTTGPPVMILHGQADTTVPFNPTANNLFESLPQPRVLVGIVGAGHSDLLESQVEPPIPARAAAESATLAFLNAYTRGNSDGLGDTLAQLDDDGHLVIADIKPVPFLTGGGVWILAALLLATRPYVALRRHRTLAT